MKTIPWAKFPYEGTWWYEALEKITAIGLFAVPVTVISLLLLYWAAEQITNHFPAIWAAITQKNRR